MSAVPTINSLAESFERRAKVAEDEAEKYKTASTRSYAQGRADAYRTAAAQIRAMQGPAITLEDLEMMK